MRIRRVEYVELTEEEAIAELQRRAKITSDMVPFQIGDIVAPAAGTAQVYGVFSAIAMMSLFGGPSASAAQVKASFTHGIVLAVKGRPQRVKVLFFDEEGREQTARFENKELRLVRRVPLPRPEVQSLEVDEAALEEVKSAEGWRVKDAADRAEARARAKTAAE